MTGNQKTASNPASAKVNDVDGFMRKLEHPMKAELEAIRRIFLAADPAITEGIKWNAPSFRTTEFFATTNLRSKDVVQIIMHFGARVNEISSTGVTIDDPDGLLQWLAKDRASIKFHDMKTIQAKSSALSAVIRQWIMHVR